MLFDEIKSYLRSGHCFGFNYFVKNYKESEECEKIMSLDEYLDLMFDEEPDGISIPLDYPDKSFLLCITLDSSKIYFYYDTGSQISPWDDLNDYLESDIIEFNNGKFSLKEVKEDKDYFTDICDVLLYIDNFFDPDPLDVYDITFGEIPEDNTDTNLEIENIIKDNLYINIALRKGKISLKDEDYLQEFNVSGLDGVVYLWQEHASFSKKTYRLFLSPDQFCEESFYCYGYELMNEKDFNNLDDDVEILEFRIEYNETLDCFYVPRNSEDYYSDSYDQMVEELIGENDDETDNSQDEITDPKEQFELALQYYYGEGIEKNEEEAVYWFSESAEQGYSEAQYSMGVCYMEGTGGLTISMYKAFQWWLKAAEQGHMEAQYNVGLCFKDGVGTLKDPYEAKDWFKKAAEQGHEKAKQNLIH